MVKSICHKLILSALVATGCLAIVHPASAKIAPTTPAPKEDLGKAVELVYIGQQLIPQPDGSILVFALYLNQDTGQTILVYVGTIPPPPPPPPGVPTIPA